MPPFEDVLVFCVLLIYGYQMTNDDSYSVKRLIRWFVSTLVSSLLVSRSQENVTVSYSEPIFYSCRRMSQYDNLLHEYFDTVERPLSFTFIQAAHTATMNAPHWIISTRTGSTVKPIQKINFDCTKHSSINLNKDLHFSNPPQNV